jgi:Spy/CpxP family protein refolding chaperone
MKNISILLMLLVSMSAFAQPKDFKEKKEKLDAMRVAFITDELELTPEEAQKFWPVFNERNNKIETLRREMMETMFKLKNQGKSLDDLTDAEIEKMMKMRFQNEKEIAKINEAYHERIVATVGLRKTAKLYMSEMHFQRKLIERSRGGKGNGERGGPPPPRD